MLQKLEVFFFLPFSSFPSLNYPNVYPSWYQTANQMLNSSSTTHLATISIEVATTDNRLSKAFKFFGAITVILLPMSLMSTFWGMNVVVPGQVDENFSNTTFFWAVVCLCLLWTLFAVIYFVKKRLF